MDGVGCGNRRVLVQTSRRVIDVLFFGKLFVSFQNSIRMARGSTDHGRTDVHVVDVHIQII